MANPGTVVSARQLRTNHLSMAVDLAVKTRTGKGSIGFEPSYASDFYSRLFSAAKVHRNGNFIGVFDKKKLIGVSASLPLTAYKRQVNREGATALETILKEKGMETRGVHYFGGVTVHPDYQRRGHTKPLDETLIQRITNAGGTAMVCIVWNERMKEILSKIGYIRIGEYFVGDKKTDVFYREIEKSNQSNARV